MTTFFHSSKKLVGLVVATLVLTIQASTVNAQIMPPAGGDHQLLLPDGLKLLPGEFDHADDEHELLSATPGARPAPMADRVHVILLVNGTDKNIGKSCLRDIQGVRNTISGAMAKDRSKLVIHNLAGRNARTGRLFSANEIMAYLKNIKVGHNDTVMVYHAGHGGISDVRRPEQTHMLFVDGGQLSRWQIERALLVKRPRSLIVLTDCCSSVARSVPESEGDSNPTLGFGHGPNFRTVYNLLVKTVGFVSITAALDGKEASDAAKVANPANASGNFTVALLRLMYRSDVTFTNWAQFYPVLRTETGRVSGGRQYARAFRLPGR